MGHIRVEQLGKAYKQYDSRWARLLDWLWPLAPVRHRLKWALRDINFEISPGEAVGIIGSNGAGKSTLLKLLCGTTQASHGSMHTAGRIAALLELGMGFHPEFTGRQNMASASQLMGLSTADLDCLTPQILAFAEIGAAIDDPVRTYSSGMQMRLAFAVATCIRPDILIVDEALAVGDIFFQQKCFKRIQEFTAAGTTLLFVSHSSGTVLNMCTRCLYLQDGKLVFDGAPRAAMDLYQASLLRSQMAPPTPAAPNLAAWSSRPPLQGKEGSIYNAAADCVGVRFLDGEGAERSTLTADEEVILELAFMLHRDLDDPHPGFKIRDRFGVVLFETNSYCMQQAPGPRSAGSLLLVRFRFGLYLFPGEYTITVGLGNGGFDAGAFREVLSYLHEVTHFVVVRPASAPLWEGKINLRPSLHYDAA